MVYRADRERPLNGVYPVELIGDFAELFGMDRCPDLGEVGPCSAGVGTCRVAGLIGGLAYPGIGIGARLHVPDEDGGSGRRTADH